MNKHNESDQGAKNTGNTGKPENTQKDAGSEKNREQTGATQKNPVNV